MTPAPRRRVSSPPLSAPNRQLKPREPAEDPQTGLKHPKFVPPPPSRMASTAHDPPEPRYDRFVMQAPTAALSAAAGGAACSAVSASAAVLYDRRGARGATGATSAFALSASARTAVLRIVVVSCRRRCGWQAQISSHARAGEGCKCYVARLRRFSLTLAHKRWTKMMPLREVS